MNTSEFDRVKARLLAIDNAQKGEGVASTAVDQKKPTLKRRTNTDGSPTDPAEPDDGGEGPDPKKSRPTLKRPGDPAPPQP
jgi:hypothetical protein